MSLDYLIENHRYVLEYSKLKEDFERYHAMHDEEFLNNLIPVLHFVCVVSYLKETPGQVLTNDEGLIHQLVHLLDEQTKPDALHELRAIRMRFDSLCRLA